MGVFPKLGGALLGSLRKGILLFGDVCCGSPVFGKPHVVLFTTGLRAGPP